MGGWKEAATQARIEIKRQQAVAEQERVERRAERRNKEKKNKPFLDKEEEDLLRELLTYLDRRRFPKNDMITFRGLLKKLGVRIL